MYGHIHQISKSFGGNPLFEEISFEIKAHDRIGLIGRNGSGKSTLLKMLAQEESPDNGAIHFPKHTKIAYLSQVQSPTFTGNGKQFLETAFIKLIEIERKMVELENEMTHTTGQTLELTIVQYSELQEYFTSHGGYEIRSKIEQVAAGLKISHLLSQPFQSLSGGEQTKLALAHVLLTEPDLLLLDEPTNHLDLQAIDWLTTFLNRFSGAFMIISHDRYFLEETVNRILDLEDGKLLPYACGYEQFVKEKEERLLQEFQNYQEQQKKIKKMKEAIKRLRIWANQANPPNEGLHKRARNMERALERIMILDRPVLEHKKIRLDLQASERSGQDVISITDLEKSFEHRRLFSNVNLLVRYGERVALLGDNGTGKSTLLQLILGQLTPESGQVKLGSQVKIAYLSQKLYLTPTNKTVIDEFREHVKVTEGEARSLLAQFLFYGYSVFQKLSSLSGGEKMRLRLAIIMQTEMNVLILDEPTNHLDIESREVLEDTISKFQGTVLAVSHDRYFIDKLFHKIAWIHAQQLYEFPGNYRWAKEKMIEVIERNEKAQPARTKNVHENKPKKPEENHHKWVQNIETLENEIERLEQKLEKETDLEKLQHLYATKENLEYEWTELMERLEGDK